MVASLSSSLFLETSRQKDFLPERDSIQRRRRRRKEGRREGRRLRFSGSGPEDRKRWSRDSGQKKGSGVGCVMPPLGQTLMGL